MTNLYDSYTSRGLENRPWSSRRVRMMPIWFFQVYLTGSVFFFAFGPWPWPVSNPMALYSFLFLVQIALWFGYVSGLRGQTKHYYGRWRLKDLLKISIIANIIWIIPNYMFTLRTQQISLSNVSSAITTGISDPAAVYAAKTGVLEGGRSALLAYSDILISPILWVLLPLSIFYWRQLSPGFRVFVLIIIVVEVSKWVAIGTFKGIVDIFLLVPVLLLAANPGVIAKIRPNSAIKFTSIFLISITLIVSVFLYFQKSRTGGEYRTYNLNASISVDEENWMVSGLSNTGKGATARLTSYLTQGYYGLALTLKEKFDWSYGVGNSFFFTGLAEHFVGEGAVFNRTYPAKIERYGWSTFNNWHSIYPWLASDVTFPGTIFLMFLIGRLFARVWIDVLHKENPFAVPLFALLVIMLFYFPANNQVLAFKRTAVAFGVLLIYWVASRRGYKLITKQPKRRMQPNSRGNII